MADVKEAIACCDQLLQQYGLWEQGYHPGPSQNASRLLSLQPPHHQSQCADHCVELVAGNSGHHSA